jgi:hypothetical protein
MVGEEAKVPQRRVPPGGRESQKAEADLRDCSDRVARLEAQFREIREMLSSIAEPRHAS